MWLVVSILAVLITLVMLLSSMNLAYTSDLYGIRRSERIVNLCCGLFALSLISLVLSLGELAYSLILYIQTKL